MDHPRLPSPSDRVRERDAMERSASSALGAWLMARLITRTNAAGKVTLLTWTFADQRGRAPSFAFARGVGERLLQLHDVTMFSVMEFGSQTGRLHWHSIAALEEGAGNLSWLMSLWERRYGFVSERVRSTSPSIGAALYVSKYVTKSLDAMPFVASGPGFRG